MEPPSSTDRFGPASASGGWLRFVTVRTIVSVSESVPSETVKVRVISSLAVTEDAVTVGVAEVRLSNVSKSCSDHEYVSSSPASSSEPDP